MLDHDIMYSKNTNFQRRKLETPLISEIINTAKEHKRKTKMIMLANKYFNKITECVIKASTQNKNSINFYYNYYDFVNDRLGKPHGFLNEFMYEMCYDFSEFVTTDTNGNPMTFKTLFGSTFDWKLIGKNMIKISW